MYVEEKSRILKVLTFRNTQLLTVMVDFQLLKTSGRMKFT